MTCEMVTMNPEGGKAKIKNLQVPCHDRNVANGNRPSSMLH